ncbi:MAG: hypothetical protein LBS76_03350 [Mycoplasmataceae bacterium]|jgi:predicted DNA-binding protein YlxM (UPF0122 family)|nr:hypothetical protein [Mycoplasmataceae bacterium]
MANNKEIVKYSELLMYYQKLFTKKQLTYLDDYFLNDLSFQEVATKYHVSAMAIADSIKHSKKLLNDYEDKLGLYKKANARAKVYNQVADKGLREKLIQIEKV